MMDINYELYKVFYYVAKTLSFSDASKALFISQSAVSQSVKTLEKKLGQNLFRFPLQKPEIPSVHIRRSVRKYNLQILVVLYHLGKMINMRLITF